MKLLIFANNRVAASTIRWLREQGDEIVGLVMHPTETRKFGEEIIAAADLPEDAIFCASELRSVTVHEKLVQVQPDVGLSLYFGYILQPELLNLFPHGCFNLHPGLLPWNRGAHPNIWSIVEETPAGVTLHQMDSSIDTGAIVAQREIPVEPIDTGKTLYFKLEDAAIQLIKDEWPRLRRGEWTLQAQAGAGSEHRARDLSLLDEIDLDKPMTARALLNQLRARTFPPHPGCYFYDGDKRILIDLKLRYDTPNKN